MKSIKKRLLAGLLGFVLVLCSCSESSSGSGSSSADAQTTTTTTAQTQQTTSESATTTQASEQSNSADASQSPDQAAVQGIPMWECTDPSGNTMIMLGSMHAAKSELYPLPDKVNNAFDSAEVLAIECDATDVDEQLQFDMQRAMTYSDGTSLKDVLSPEAYEVFCDQLAEIGYTDTLFQSYKPWAAYEVLSTFWILGSGLDTTYGLDYYLINKAKNSNKPLYEFESTQFQIDLFANTPDKAFDAMLKALKGSTKQDAIGELLTMYDNWLKGDMDAIAKSELDASDEAYQKAGLNAEDIAAIRAYKKAVNDDRNVGIASKIKELFKSGKKTMVVIGAAHFCGDSSVISLLEKDGYTFKRI